ARVASPHCPILRPSLLSVPRSTATVQIPPSRTWLAVGRWRSPVSAFVWPRLARPDLPACRQGRKREFRGQSSGDRVPGRVAPGIAPLGLPQIRTCTFAHTAPHIMSSLRDGSLSESALRLVPDAATVVVSWTRLWVSMHPPCFPPTVS